MPPGKGANHVNSFMRFRSHCQHLLGTYHFGSQLTSAVVRMAWFSLGKENVLRCHYDAEYQDQKDHDEFVRRGMHVHLLPEIELKNQLFALVEAAISALRDRAYLTAQGSHPSSRAADYTQARKLWASLDEYELHAGPLRPFVPPPPDQVNLKEFMKIVGSDAHWEIIENKQEKRKRKVPDGATPSKPTRGPSSNEPVKNPSKKPEKRWRVTYGETYSKGDVNRSSMHPLPDQHRPSTGPNTPRPVSSSRSPRSARSARPSPKENRLPPISTIMPRLNPFAGANPHSPGVGIEPLRVPHPDKPQLQGDTQGRTPIPPAVQTVERLSAPASSARGIQGGSRDHQNLSSAWHRPYAPRPGDLPTPPAPQVQFVIESPKESPRSPSVNSPSNIPVVAPRAQPASVKREGVASLIRHSSITDEDIPSLPSTPVAMDVDHVEKAAYGDSSYTGSPPPVTPSPPLGYARSIRTSPLPSDEEMDEGAPREFLSDKHAATSMAKSRSALMQVTVNAERLDYGIPLNRIRGYISHSSVVPRAISDIDPQYNRDNQLAYYQRKYAPPSPEALSHVLSGPPLSPPRSPAGLADVMDSESSEKSDQPSNKFPLTRVAEWNMDKSDD